MASQDLVEDAPNEVFNLTKSSILQVKTALGRRFARRDFVNRWSWFLLIILFPNVVISCATVTSGSTETLSIKSNPGKARVTISNSKAEVVADATTPISINLSRGAGYFIPEEYKISVSKEGYIGRSLSLKSHLNSGWYLFGNFFSFNSLGWVVVDPITGAMWQLDSNSIFVELKKADNPLELNEEETRVEIVPRPKVHYDPWVAGTAALFVPGAGHYYQEKWGTGALITVTGSLLGGTIFALGYAGQDRKPWFWGLYGGYLALTAFSVTDAVRLALESDK